MLEKDSNVMKYMANPRGFTLRKWLLQILQNRFEKHESIVERLGGSMATDGDLQAFGRLATELYEVGYLKAVNDYKEQFEKLGIKVNIVPTANQ